MPNQPEPEEKSPFPNPLCFIIRMVKRSEIYCIEIFEEETLNSFELFETTGYANAKQAFQKICNKVDTSKFKILMGFESSCSSFIKYQVNTVFFDNLLSQVFSG